MFSLKNSLYSAATVRIGVNGSSLKGASRYLYDYFETNIAVNLSLEFHSPRDTFMDRHWRNVRKLLGS